MKAENFKPFYTSCGDVNIDGENAVRVVKTDRIYDFDINSFARLNHVKFHNGTIKVKVMSRLLPDCDERYKGAYVGLAFRISDDSERFECFCVRPGAGTKERPDSTVGAQYFSCPEYTLACFREKGIHDDHGKFYVNDMETPLFDMEHLFHGKGEAGGNGLFTDIGAEAFFRDLEIIEE